jgi:para-aminobenzoate synthetase component 1
VKSAATTFIIDDYNIFKNKMLNWANRFNIFCFLDNHCYSHDAPAFDCMLAAGSKRSFRPEPDSNFASLRAFYDEHPGWLFGHFGYELKNEVEHLFSRHKNFIDFGNCFFFEPEIVLKLQKHQLIISSEVYDAQKIFDAIIEEPDEIVSKVSTNVTVQSSISKEAYLHAIHALKQHIIRGDCYEINFCQHFFAKDAIIDPLYIYSQLVAHSPNPFAALYKLNNRYCLCASPERYLKKTGQTILSQPMKGTSKRNDQDAAADEASKNYLNNSSKERSENVMVVDLVRNDLSRICKEGSVYVDELFAVHSFPQVHQMISTIKGELADNLHWTDAIKATFPMGSMTGAPKKRVMELIDEYESSARGLFSGSIGYINPEGDFDFNVVIRSIFYDAQKRDLSFSAGGGITFNSIAEEEYKESMLKAEAILHVLQLQ